MSYTPPPPYQPPNQQPGFPPQQGYPPPGYPVQAPAKKSKHGVLIAVVVGAVFVFCGSMALIGFLGNDEVKKPAGSSAAAADDPADGPVDKPKPAPLKDEPTDQFGLAVGKPLILQDGNSKQEITVKSFKFYKSCDGIGDPKLGGYLVVDVQVVQKAGVGSANSLSFEYVSDSGGTANSMSGLFSGCDDGAELSATNSLRAGQKRAGKVVFDVKSAAGEIEYTPDWLSKTAGSWKLK